MKKRFYLTATVLLASLLSITSCIGFVDIGLDRPHYQPEEEYDINKVMFVQNNAWRISIDDRYVVQEYGRDVYVDKFFVQANDRMTYYMDIISEDQLRKTYDGSIFNRIKEQCLGLIRDHNEGYIDLDKELMHGNQTIEFNRLNSGYWYAYCFGMWSDGKLSGDYQLVQFRVTAEKPTIEYMQWLGSWEIGDHRNRYEILVRQDEPNYTYAVTGWEANNPDAENYVLITDFNRKNGDMVFYNQILGDFQDNNKNWYDIMFCGSFYYRPMGQAEDLLTVIGPSTMAYAVYPDRKNVTTVNGAISSTEVDGVNYPFTFNFMHLRDVPVDEDLPMLTYNDVVPEFPYQMTRLESYSAKSAAETAAPRINKAVRHKKETVRIRRK